MADQLFESAKNLEIGKAYTKVLSLVQLWTNLLEKSLTPTLHTVADLFLQAPFIFDALMQKENHPLQWKNSNYRLVDAMEPLIFIMKSTFDSYMEPDILHYKSMYIHPLSLCLEGRTLRRVNGPLHTPNSIYMEILRDMESIAESFGEDEIKYLETQAKKRISERTPNLVPPRTVVNKTKHGMRLIKTIDTANAGVDVNLNMSRDELINDQITFEWVELKRLAITEGCEELALDKSAKHFDITMLVEEMIMYVFYSY